MIILSSKETVTILYITTSTNIIRTMLLMTTNISRAVIKKNIDTITHTPVADTANQYYPYLRPLNYRKDQEDTITEATAVFISILKNNLTNSIAPDSSLFHSLPSLTLLTLPPRATTRWQLCANQLGNELCISRVNDGRKSLHRFSDGPWLDVSRSAQLECHRYNVGDQWCQLGLGFDYLLDKPMSICDSDVSLSLTVVSITIKLESRGFKTARISSLDLSDVAWLGKRATFTRHKKALGTALFERSSERLEKVGEGVWHWRKKRETLEKIRNLRKISWDIKERKKKIKLNKAKKNERMKRNEGRKEKRKKKWRKGE